MSANAYIPVTGHTSRIAKRELSPLRRACLSLGLPVEAQPGTNLARLLRSAGLGQTAIEQLKFCHDDLAKKLVDMYYSLNLTERKAVTIDYLIMAVGADVHRVSGLIQEGLSRTTDAQATLLLATNSLSITKKVIECAMTPNGHKDREMVLRMMGFLPTMLKGLSDF